MAMTKDYYKTLGVSKSATKDDIKKSYRKMAREYHPDARPNDKNAEQKFRDITEAYEVLSNAEKRKKYDQQNVWQRFQRSNPSASNQRRKYEPYSTDYSSPGFSARQTSNPFTSTRPKSSNSTASGKEPDLDSAFEQFGGFKEAWNKFNTMFNKADQDSSQAPSPNEQHVAITLEEAFHGTKKTITAPGSQKKFSLNIKPGMKDLQKLKISNAGKDFFVRLHILPHKRFELKNNDLYVEAPVEIWKAALGGEAPVKTMTKTINLKIPQGTQGGTLLRLKGFGMPISKGKSGDLYVRVNISLPKNLTEREKQLFTELARLRNG